MRVVFTAWFSDCMVMFNNVVGKMLLHVSILKCR